MYSKRDKFLMKIQRTIRDHGLIPEGAHMLVAVSGGADSVALARALAALREMHGWRLTLCYVHHRQRVAADEEAKFVETLAQDLEVGFELRNLPSDFQARHRTGSLEADMRAARYRELNEAAQKLGAAFIATGHHGDDLAETVLWNLLRGSGTNGLKGFEARTDVFGMTVVRPLIQCTRGEIRAWLTEQGLDWRDDESNEDLTRPRNRLRHEILPLIRDNLQPNIGDVLRRTADIAGAEAQLLDNIAACLFNEICHNVKDDLWRINLTDNAKAESALRRRVARMILSEMSGTPADSRVSLAFEEWLFDDNPGSVFRQLGGMVGYRDYDLAYVFKSSASKRTGRKELLDEVREKLWKSGVLKKMMTAIARPESERCVINVEKLRTDGIARIDWNGLRWVFGWGSDPDNDMYMMDKTHIPIALLGDQLDLRFRQDGDRVVRGDGRPGKKLKELMIDWKVPLVGRDWMPLLANERGVLWIPGIEEWITRKQNREKNKLNVSDKNKERRESNEGFLCVQCDFARD